MTDAWKVTAGDPAVTVGVADTGLDFTHSELAPKVSAVVDFTRHRGPADLQDLLHAGRVGRRLGGAVRRPSQHRLERPRLWIGGNIAAALDGTGINGIAPKVNLVAAQDLAVVRVGLRLGDPGRVPVRRRPRHRRREHLVRRLPRPQRSRPGRDLRSSTSHVVKYAKSKGTMIVAAAGNEHVRVGAGGKVRQPRPADDARHDAGRLQDCSACTRPRAASPASSTCPSTGNVVNASSASCAPPRRERRPTFDLQADRRTRTSRPASGRRTSWPTTATTGRASTSPRRVAPASSTCPCGTAVARRGFPYTTADGTTAWEDFSITSNWALEIPCFTFTGGRLPGRPVLLAPSRARRWRRRTPRPCWP